MSEIEDKAYAAVMQHVRDQGIGRSLNGHDPNGEPEGFVTDHNALHDLSASTHILVKDIADLLTKKFPGFRWAIQPSEFGKVFNIFCLDFHARYGYRIKYTDIMNDPKRREVIKAGAEILRRFKYPGTVYRPERMMTIKRNTRGEAIPDISDFKKDRFKQRVELEQALADGNARIVGTSGSGHIIEVRGK